MSQGETDEEKRWRLAALVESSDDAIISKSLDGIIRTWNRGATMLFGYSEEEAIGRPILMLLPPDRVDEETMIMGKLHRGELIKRFETVRRRKDGTLFEVSLTISPIFDAAGKIVGASKIARDITRQKMVEEALRKNEARFRELAASEAKLRRAAEQLNRTKDQFLATLSHELRTPLTPVLAILSNLSIADNLPQSIAQDLAMIRRNVELETRLIDDLLDLTRITRGKMELHCERIVVDRLVENAIGTCLLEFSARSLSYLKDLGAPGAFIHADGVRLTQIIWNLLKNAIKFTPPGGAIAVRTRLEPDGRVAISVRDTGRGIEPSKISLIFNAFEQGGRDVTRQFGGLGLGLAISKAIAEAHSGTLSASSEGPDKGSTFTLTLPLSTDQASADAGVPASARPAAPPSNGASGPTRRKRLLLIEDHADTATILMRTLRDTGYEVVRASTVAEALAAADSETARGGIDLVLSDLSLPDGTGFDLMRELSSRHGLRGISLSGFGMDSDRERSLASGFMRHLVKPVDIELMRRVIAESLEAVE